MASHACRAGGCVVGASGASWASVWLSRGFSRLVALTLVTSGPVVSWTASVESARRQPTAFLTTRAFYGSDLGPLRGSDLAVFSFVCQSLRLSLLLSGNPTFPFQRLTTFGSSHDSAVHQLSPFSRSGSSNPGGIRWSPHLLPIPCTLV